MKRRRLNLWLFTVEYANWGKRWNGHKGRWGVRRECDTLMIDLGPRSVDFWRNR